MGRKQKNVLGQALMKTQKRSSATRTTDVQSSAGKHVSERDGGDAAVALASYLEGSSLDDFLASAVLANREFTAEKERMVILDSEQPTIVAVSKGTNSVPEMSFSELKVPRRPNWDSSTTPEELNRREKESFLSWRREIALMEDATGDREVTPFEKNLEVWRQLWHVRERSDVVVQIVDARNPLFYRSADLDAYAQEGDYKRKVLLIVNKSDFLTSEQRKLWSEYFQSQKINFLFFSAKSAQLLIDEAAKKARRDDSSDLEQGEESSPVNNTNNSNEEQPVLTREELLDRLSRIAHEVLAEVGVRDRDKGLIKFGMVGFPNVGKSSVINALLGASTYSSKAQRVAVGSTPGKTKHFQTLILSDEIMLCDCPGLVFPSFVNSKAEMYCCGVLPISQLRDHVAPLALLCGRIPRVAFEKLYGIKLSDSPNGQVDVYDLLEAYARNRGYTTTGKGGPDTSRAARDLLRHYVNGKLLYCHPPPNHADNKAFDPQALVEHLTHSGVVPGSDVVEVNDVEAELMAEKLPNEKVFSKRLKKHGRKGRKGRDKNPYEDSDLPSGVSLVHVNSGGKKKRYEPRNGSVN